MGKKERKNWEKVRSEHGHLSQGGDYVVHHKVDPGVYKVYVKNKSIVSVSNIALLTNIVVRSKENPKKIVCAKEKEKVIGGRGKNKGCRLRFEVKPEIGQCLIEIEVRSLVKLGKVPYSIKIYHIPQKALDQEAKVVFGVQPTPAAIDFIEKATKYLYEKASKAGQQQADGSDSNNKKEKGSRTPVKPKHATSSSKDSHSSSSSSSNEATSAGDRSSVGSSDGGTASGSGGIFHRSESGKHFTMSIGNAQVDHIPNIFHRKHRREASRDSASGGEEKEVHPVEPHGMFEGYDFARKHKRLDKYADKINSGILKKTFAEIDEKKPSTVEHLLLHYFVTLPQTFLGGSLYDIWIACYGVPDEESRIECIRKVLNYLPSAKMKILKRLCWFIKNLAKRLGQDTSGFANVFAPILLRNKDEDVEQAMQATDLPYRQFLIKHIIDNAEIFFGRERSPVFGYMPNEDALELVETLISLLRRALTTGEEGLFRVPGNKNRIEKYKKAINAGDTVDFSQEEEISTLASLLKAYFIELPMPLLGSHHYDMLIAAHGIPDAEARLEIIKKATDYLPPLSHRLLQVLCAFLSDVAANPNIKMDASNLAVVFAPSLLRPREQNANDSIKDYTHTQALMITLITEYEFFFGKKPTSPAPEAISSSRSTSSKGSNTRLFSSSPAITQIASRLSVRFPVGSPPLKDEDFSTVSTVSTPSSMSSAPALSPSHHFIDMSQKVVVIDNGSGMIKAGLAGAEVPSCVFPSIVGVPLHQKVMSSSTDEVFIGHQAQNLRGVLHLKHPVQHGIVQDWDDLEKMWEYTFQNLRLSPDEHPVLLAEPPMNPRRNRERLLEIMFEIFGVPATYVAIQAVLALYSTGRTTGIVLDSGEGITHVVPTYEGHSVNHAISRLDMAGGDLTEYLKTLLTARGYNQFQTSATTEIVRGIKEKLCYVALDFEKESSSSNIMPNLDKSFRLPDGNEITVGAERFQCPEALFDPSILGREAQTSRGIHQMCHDAIHQCSEDLRRVLYENVVLSGGSTMFPNLDVRLHSELKALAPSLMRVHITSPTTTTSSSATPDRRFAVWQGGSILGSLPQFRDMWITADEYSEYGAVVVHRKCF